MATVYRAHDPRLARSVALKLLHQRSEEPRLVREAQALARLAHPNVVAVYDVGRFKDRLFVAMELIEGQTLRRWFADAPRTWTEVLEVMVHAGRGLVAAHEAELVHRDFKPDNVIIGRDGRVRVLDFGIAVRSDPLPERSSSMDGAADAAALEAGDADDSADPTLAESSRLTQTGAMIGTPAYMAPEQHSGFAGPECDQFSFCVVFWEGLYGQRPFGGENLAALAYNIAHGILSPPARPVEAPGWLRAVLRRGLAPDPRARHRSMASLLAQIEAARGRRERESGTAIAKGRYRSIHPMRGALSGRASKVLDAASGRVRCLMPVARDEADAALLAQEFVRRAAIRHPNVAGVVDFGLDAGRPYFILDLEDEPEGFVEGAKKRPPALQRALLAECLRGLAHLHALGFGAALSSEGVVISGGHAKLLSLAAVATPLVDAEVAADLAAVGGLAYELLGGRPLTREDLPVIGGASPPAGRTGTRARPELPVIGGASPPAGRTGTRARPELPVIGGASPPAGRTGTPPPRPTSSRAPLSRAEAEPELAEWVERLLSDDAAVRPASAREALLALGRLAGSGTLVADTLETRESRLASAPIVGRATELARLRTALEDAALGKGSAWLIGGESGAGKSRLLEELERLGLAHGFLVLSGQEQPDGGPYRLWRDPLHALAALAELDPLEASVLLPVVPDLPTLAGYAIEPALELEPNSMQARLHDVVAGLMRRQGPLVLLLEDAHWSTSESLKLLAGLAPIAAELPLLILVSHRSEERPELPRLLAAFRRLDLGRLSSGALAELAEGLLGSGSGAAVPSPELLQLIETQTEGNAFFVIEAFRALAEEAGALERIREAPLPESIFGGGMRRVVERRLERAGSGARLALRWAAVLGRTIEPELLLALLPELDLPAWLAECESLAILERRDAVHRFRHDKLREALLDEPTADELRTMHARAGEAIETLYGSAPDRWATLAHHFRAGARPEKERHYALSAGELALASSSDQEAAELLARALELAPAGHPDRARLHASLGHARFFLDDLSGAAAHLFAVGAEVGRAFPKARGELLSCLLRQIAVQAAHRLLPGRFVARSVERRRALLLLADAAARLSNLHIYANDGLAVLCTSLLAVNLAESAGRRHALSLGLLGYAAGTLGLRELAARYFAEMHASEAPGLHSRSYGSGVIAEGSHWLARADFARAGALMQKHRLHCQQIGDRLNESYASYIESFLAYYRGELAEGKRAARFAQNNLDASLRGHAVHFGIAEALITCAMGRLDEAEQILRSYQGRLSGFERLPEANWFGVLAMIEARRGDVGGATAAVEHIAARQVGSVRDATGISIVAGALEAAMLAFERGRESGAELPPLLARLRAAERLARSWARVVPIGRAQVLFYEGRIARLLGRPDDARRAFERCSELSSAMSLELLREHAAAELRPALPAPRAPEDA
jgi:tRNA A-37 threonylcarbamoyl transferase component Bud32